MLTFESPFYEEEGIVVFRDHAVSTLFYYLAGPPRLALDESGRPQFTLLKYRHAIENFRETENLTRDQLGGGFLTFAVDCRLDPGQKDAIADKLQARMPPDAGPISLVPVLYSEGTVHVLALDADSRTSEDDDAAESKFIRKVLGSATPSLLQDQGAIFSLALTPDAADLLEAAYESELSPIGVMYELKFAGLRPSVGIIAKVHMDRLYDKLSMELGVSLGTDGGGGGSEEGEAAEEGSADRASAGGSAGTAAEIDIKLGMVLENMVENADIDIKIVQQQSGEAADKAREGAMTLLKEALLKDLFQPVMSTTPRAPAQVPNPSTVVNMLQAGSGNTSSGQTSEGGAGVQIGFELKYQRREELREREFDFSQQSPEERVHAPNGFFSALVSGTTLDDHIKEVALDSEFFKMIEVEAMTTAEWEALNLQALVLHFQYGGDVDEPGFADSHAFTPEKTSPVRFRTFRDGGGWTFRHRTEYKFGQTDDVSAEDEVLNTEWKEATGRSLVVHPPEDLDLLRVFIETGRVDWEVIDRIESTLRYHDPGSDFSAETTFAFEAETQAQTWALRLPNGALRDWSVQHVWFLSDGNRLESEVLPQKGSRLFLNEPFEQRMDILIDPLVSPDKVHRITVELEYIDEENGLEVHKSAELVGPDFRATRLSFPLIDLEKRTYTYEVRLVKRDGTVEARGPEESDGLSILVTESGKIEEVTVALLGRMETQAVLGVQVDLRTQPDPAEPPLVEGLFFEPGGEARSTLRLRVPTDRAFGFEYRLQIFLEDGTQKDVDWTAHDSRTLPLPLARFLRADP